MVTYLSDDLSADGNTLFIDLGGDRLTALESWDVNEGVLTQPSSFSLSFGWSNISAGLFRKYPKNTPFTLFIGGNPQATGRTDGVEVNQPPGGASTITIKGRDLLKKLHDTYVKANTPVAVGTYADLVWFALYTCGLVTSKTSDPNILKTDNAANRQIKAGVPITAIAPHRTVQQLLLNEFPAGATAPNVASVTVTPKAKVGETWLRFVRRYLDRAGLFFWANADGTFTLAAPDGNQPASYALIRRAEDPNKTGNIIGCRFSDDATDRHTEAVIYGRGGRKQAGRGKAKGVFTDQELIDAGYDTQPICFRDCNVHTPAEAEFFARRKLAEERRDGYRIEYTISGLTLPFLGGGGGERAVVTIDTVVSVYDEHLGIEDNFYIESVRRSRAPQTTTTMRLMRVEDLIFASPDEEEDG